MLQIIIFVILIICAILLPVKNEHFEQVKIKLKPNPLNINLNNTNDCANNNNYPEIIVPIYAPWRTYWPASLVYPYYPFYPYYYNNYFLPN